METSLYSKKISNFLKISALRIGLLVIILSLVSSACRFTPFSDKDTPTPPTAAAEVLPKVTPSPTLVDSDLAVVDDGSPLAPNVIEQQPVGGQELPVDGKIVISFDQNMDQEKTAGALSVTDPDGKNVPGTVSWSDARTLQFQPSQALTQGNLYAASLGDTASSEQGVGMNEPYSFHFMTTGEMQVSQVFPADGSQDIDSSAVITVIFNRPVVPLTILEEQADLPDPLSFNPPVSGTGEWINTSVYAFQPDPALQGGETYIVRVNAGLADALGESSLAEDYAWRFTTIQPGIDFFELSSGRSNPNDYYENVLLDEYFRIKFLQPMDRGSTEAALSLTAASGEKANLISEWNDDSTQVVITPTLRLSSGTSYLLDLSTQAQAATGGELRDGIRWNFTTVPPPDILFTRPGHQQAQDSFYREFYIKFASPMRIDSVKERIVISPEPEKEPDWWYNEWDWSLSAFFLEPSTNYEIRFLPGMEDIYGNATTTEKFVQFTTPARPASANLLMPYQPAVMRASGPAESQQFYAAYRNVDSVRFELYSLSQDDFFAFLTGESNSYEYLPPAGDLVWQAQEQSQAGLNERVVKSYQLTNQTGEALEPGFYLLGMNSPQVYSERPFSDRRLIVVANANLTLKTSERDSLVWLTDLESGEPIQDVKVNVYNTQALGAPWKTETGSDGTAYLDFVTLGAGQNPNTNGGSGGLQMQPQEFPQGSGEGEYFALADDGGVFAFAASNWGADVPLGEYGIWRSYYAPASKPTAYVYTERPIYRPGQPVFFKGIVRLDDDLDYEIPAYENVRIEIENFKEVVFEGDISLTEFGSFDGKFTLDSETALGYYTIQVFLPGDEGSIGSVTFNVAEYRKPEFQVEVSTEPADLLDGESFTALVQADYYSGGGVPDALVEWTLTSDPFSFSPPDDYSNYNFSDYEADAYRYESDDEQGSKVIAEGQGQTNAGGTFETLIPADLSDYKTSRQLTFEATVTDISKNSVSGRSSVTAHRSAVYPGVRPKQYIGEQDKEQTFEIVALDWDGDPIPNQAIQVEIVERRWYSVQEQDATGRIQWTSSVEEIPVTSFDDLQTDNKGEAEVNFTPPAGGIYRAKVSAPDPAGNLGQASAFMWVAGKSYIPWRQTNDRSFDLVTDKKNYSPGEQAEVLIASPFQGEAQALVTVERGRIRYQEVVLLDSNSTIYKLPISTDMAPNVYISVVVVKGVDDTSPRPNFKMGITEIGVDRNEQIVQVELEAEPETAGPGEQVLFTVTTSDFQGEPLSAEVSMSLSDLATLSLMPPNSEPIEDHFYNKRSLGVWTSVPIALSIDEYNANIQETEVDGGGMGSGGGKGIGDLGVVAVRQDFPDTAFWDAFVKTNENGQASVAVTLPDNLTTWRMDARAVTKGTLVGQTTLDIISSKPLLLRPQTPRFFVVNDHVRLGAAVQNNSEKDIEAQVTLEAEGLTLLGEAEQSLEVPAGGQVYVSWDAAVKMDAERVDLIFRVEGGGLSDASRPPQGTLDNQGIPVYRYEARETVGTSGMMTGESTLVEAITLPESMQVTSGDLTVKVSPSLAAGMTDGLTYLEHYPYECVEQTISRFLPNVISTRALKAAGLSDPSLEAALDTQVETALQRLYNWQNADGGWGWWSGQESNALTSAYTVLGLVEADEAGYQVNDEVILRGLEYLSTQIVPLTGLADPSKSNRQAFILYVMARAGQPDISSSVQLYEQRQRIALYANAYLVQTLYIIDPDDPRVDTLLSDFTNSAINSATGSHWEEESFDRWNWNTDTRTTAIILSAVSLIDSQNPLNANAVRWLMSNRDNGHWRGTQETAWSLMALTNWMVASGELKADYQYAVALNGERLGGGIANAETLRQSLALKVDVSSLLKDEANRLAFARDGGDGNLYYTAHLNLDLPVEQIRAADQGVVVSRSYYRLDDPETPVEKAQQGELLLVRLTVVAPNALHYLVIDDPLPAGLEAVDQTLLTSPQSVEVPKAYSMDDVFFRGWGWWYFTHTQMYDERTLLSSSYLPAGTYVYTYLARASSVGVFRTIPTTAQEFYFPEVYGRGEGRLFTVTP